MRNIEKAIADLGAAVHALADFHSPADGLARWDGISLPGIFDGTHRSMENDDVWDLETKFFTASDQEALLVDLDKTFGAMLKSILGACP